MKRLIIIISIFTLIASSCKVNKNLSTHDKGVVINGVKWATRNVDNPGTFAKLSKDAGMLYQWDSKIGWSSTEPIVSTDGSFWNTSWNDGSSATSWQAANNICPVGWRIPTKEEIESLVHSGSKWMKNGRLFGSDNNTLFLPAAGFRFDSGRLDKAGEYGYYWSSMSHKSTEPSAYLLFFDSDDAYSSNDYSSAAYCVRCVAETY